MGTGTTRAWIVAAVASAPLVYGCALLAGLEDDRGPRPAPDAGTGGGTGGIGGAGGTGAGGAGGAGGATTGPGGGGSGGGVGGGCNDVDGGAGPVDLTTHPLGVTPRAIAVLGNSIYWTTEGPAPGSNAIWKMDKDCLAPVKIADATTKKPVSLAVDSGNVFWSDDGSAEGSCAVAPQRDRVMTAPSGPPMDPPSLGVPIYTGCGKADSITLTSSTVYWARSSSHRVQSRAKQGGSIGDVYTDPNMLDQPFAITADEAGVYWTDKFSKKVLLFVISPPNITDFAALSVVPEWIGLDAQDVYWTAPGEMMKLSKSSPGGSATTIATGLPPLAGIAVDSDPMNSFVYALSDTGGNVLKIPKDGSSAPQQLPTNDDDLNGVAVDDTFVYWTSGATRAVGRQPK